MARISVKEESGEQIMTIAAGPIAVADLTRGLLDAVGPSRTAFPRLLLGTHMLQPEDVVGGDIGEAEVELSVIWLAALEAASLDLRDALGAARATQQTLELLEDELVELEVRRFEISYMAKRTSPTRLCMICRCSCPLDYARDGSAASEACHLEIDLAQAQVRMEDARRDVVETQRIIEEKAAACWEQLVPRMAEFAGHGHGEDGAIGHATGKSWCSVDKISALDLAHVLDQLGVSFEDTEIESIAEAATASLGASRAHTRECADSGMICHCEAWNRNCLMGIAA